MMKTKMLAVVMAAAIATTASAQKMTYDAGKTTFGIRAGANMTTINGENANGEKWKNNLNTNFHAGVNAEIPVGTGSYIQPGVLFAMKGADWDNGSELRLNYIEVPVNFVYKPILGQGRMLLGFGPYAGIGVGGKMDMGNGNEKKVEFTNEYQLTNTNPQLRRIDGGANFLAGYEFANNLSLQLNAQLGLINLAPEINGADNKSSYKNTGFGISAGYRF